MKNKVKVLIAPDSFKESLSAAAVCENIQIGWLKALPQSDIRCIPMADGGEGTIDALLHHLTGQRIQMQALDPLQRIVTAEYGYLPDQQLAIIEMAKISGLERLSESEKNPEITTTYGTGQLILDALDRGCRSFIIGIGGSATNDGGAGMLEALGFQFLDHQGHSIPRGGSGLLQLHTIQTNQVDPRLKEAKFNIACDVDNPLLGPNGASYTFGPQKGGQPDQIEKLERSLSHFASILEKTVGRSIQNLPGAGAAGGLGAGFLALPYAHLRSGFDIIQETVQLSKHIAWADLIITGEGKIDHQTIHGKLPFGVAQLAKIHEKPVICIAGTVGSNISGLHEAGLSAIFSILTEPVDLNTALAHGSRYLQRTAEQIARLYQINLNP